MQRDPFREMDEGGAIGTTLRRARRAGRRGGVDGGDGDEQEQGTEPARLSR